MPAPPSSWPDDAQKMPKSYARPALRSVSQVENQVRALSAQNESVHHGIQGPTVATDSRAAVTNASASVDTKGLMVIFEFDRGSNSMAS